MKRKLNKKVDTHQKLDGLAEPFFKALYLPLLKVLMSSLPWVKGLNEATWDIDKVLQEKLLDKEDTLVLHIDAFIEAIGKLGKLKDLKQECTQCLTQFKDQYHQYRVNKQLSVANALFDFLDKSTKNREISADKVLHELAKKLSEEEDSVVSFSEIKEALNNYFEQVSPKDKLKVKQSLTNIIRPLYEEDGADYWKQHGETLGQMLLQSVEKKKQKIKQSKASDQQKINQSKIAKQYEKVIGKHRIDIEQYCQAQKQSSQLSAKLKGLPVNILSQAAKVNMDEIINKMGGQDLEFVLSTLSIQEDYNNALKQVSDTLLEIDDKAAVQHFSQALEQWCSRLETSSRSLEQLIEDTWGFLDKEIVKPYGKLDSLPSILKPIQAFLSDTLFLDKKNSKAVKGYLKKVFLYFLRRVSNQVKAVVENDPLISKTDQEEQKVDNDQVLSNLLIASSEILWPSLDLDVSQMNQEARLKFDETVKEKIGPLSTYYDNKYLLYSKEHSCKNSALSHQRTLEEYKKELKNEIKKLKKISRKTFAEGLKEAKEAAKKGFKGTVRFAGKLSKKIKRKEEKSLSLDSQEILMQVENTLKDRFENVILELEHKKKEKETWLQALKNKKTKENNLSLKDQRDIKKLENEIKGLEKQKDEQKILIKIKELKQKKDKQEKLLREACLQPIKMISVRVLSGYLLEKLKIHRDKQRNKTHPLDEEEGDKALLEASKKTVVKGKKDVVEVLFDEIMETFGSNRFLKEERTILNQMDYEEEKQEQGAVSKDHRDYVLRLLLSEKIVNKFLPILPWSLKKIFAQKEKSWIPVGQFLENFLVDRLDSDAFKDFIAPLKEGFQAAIKGFNADQSPLKLNLKYAQYEDSDQTSYVLKDFIKAFLQSRDLGSALLSVLAVKGDNPQQLEALVDLNTQITQFFNEHQEHLIAHLYAFLPKVLGSFKRYIDQADKAAEEQGLSEQSETRLGFLRLLVLSAQRLIAEDAQKAQKQLNKQSSDAQPSGKEAIPVFKQLLSLGVSTGISQFQSALGQVVTASGQAGSDSMEEKIDEQASVAKAFSAWVSQYLVGDKKELLQSLNQSALTRIIEAPEQCLKEEQRTYWKHFFDRYETVGKNSTQCQKNLDVLLKKAVEDIEDKSTLPHTPIGRLIGQLCLYGDDHFYEKHMAPVLLEEAKINKDDPQVKSFNNKFFKFLEAQLDRNSFRIWKEKFLELRTAFDNQAENRGVLFCQLFSNPNALKKYDARNSNNKVILVNQPTRFKKALQDFFFDALKSVDTPTLANAPVGRLILESFAKGDDFSKSYLKPILKDSNNPFYVYFDDLMKGDTKTLCQNILNTTYKPHFGFISSLGFSLMPQLEQEQKEAEEAQKARSFKSGCKLYVEARLNESARKIVIGKIESKHIVELEDLMADWLKRTDPFVSILVSEVKKAMKIVPFDNIKQILFVKDLGNTAKVLWGMIKIALQKNIVKQPIKKTLLDKIAGLSFDKKSEKSVKSVSHLLFKWLESLGLMERFTVLLNTLLKEPPKVEWLANLSELNNKDKKSAFNELEERGAFDDFTDLVCSNIKYTVTCFKTYYTQGSGDFNDTYTHQKEKKDKGSQCIGMIPRWLSFFEFLIDLGLFKFAMKALIKKCLPEIRKHHQTFLAEKEQRHQKHQLEQNKEDWINEAFDFSEREQNLKSNMQINPKSDSSDEINQALFKLSKESCKALEETLKAIDEEKQDEEVQPKDKEPFNWKAVWKEGEDKIKQSLEQERDQFIKQALKRMPAKMQALKPYKLGMSEAEAPNEPLKVGGKDAKWMGVERSSSGMQPETSISRLESEEKEESDITSEPSDSEEAESLESLERAIVKQWNSQFKADRWAFEYDKLQCHIRVKAQLHKRGLKDEVAKEEKRDQPVGAKVAPKEESSNNELVPLADEAEKLNHEVDSSKDLGRNQDQKADIALIRDDQTESRVEPKRSVPERFGYNDSIRPYRRYSLQHSSAPKKPTRLPWSFIFWNCSLAAIATGAGNIVFLKLGYSGSFIFPDAFIQLVASQMFGSNVALAAFSLHIALFTTIVFAGFSVCKWVMHAKDKATDSSGKDLRITDTSVRHESSDSLLHSKGPGKRLSFGRESTNNPRLESSSSSEKQP